jgi:hypothetical protein
VPENSTGLPEPGQLVNPWAGFSGIADFIQHNPVGFMLIVLVVLILVAVFIWVVRGGVVHHYARRMHEYLTSPLTDVLVLALDPDTRTAKLLAAKRVGPLYVSHDEVVFIVPVQGGEIYTLEGTGKPLMVAIRYSKTGFQASPGLEQQVSLMLAPATASPQAEPRDLNELYERLLKNIQGVNSSISGELYIGPDMKVFVSTKVPAALQSLATETAQMGSTVLLTAIQTFQAITEETKRITEILTSGKVALRRLWIQLILVIGGVVAILLFVLHSIGMI